MPRFDLPIEELRSYHPEISEPEYGFNKHEGGQGMQWEKQTAFLAEQLAG